MGKRKSDSGFVYIWFDKKHKRFYIGSHWGYPTDKYICSSNWMIKAYKKRPEDFRRRILETVCTIREELYDREYYWLSFIPDHELGKRYYNLKKCKHVGTIYTDEMRAKMATQKNNIPSPETIAKRVASIKKTMSTPEKKIELSAQAHAIWATPGHREAMSQHLRDQWADPIAKEARVTSITSALNKPEVKQKISENSIQMWQDPEYRTLQAEKHTGITLPPRTEEQIEVNRIAQLKLWSTSEHIKKMSDAHLNSETAMASSRENIKKTHTPEARAKRLESLRRNEELNKTNPEYIIAKKDAARTRAMKRWHPELFVSHINNSHEFTGELNWQE